MSETINHAAKHVQVADYLAQQVRAGVTVIEAALNEHGKPYILGTELSPADICLVHGLRAAQVMLCPFLVLSCLLKLPDGQQAPSFHDKSSPLPDMPGKAWEQDWLSART